MSQPQPWLTIESCEQAPIQRGPLSVTPQAQVLTVRTPLGIWRWVRPEALLVQDDQGLARVTIHDPTRWSWLGVWLLATLWLLVLRSRTDKSMTRRH